VCTNVQGCAWVFVCSSCCAPFWHGFAFALLCLGFSLAQPALFARIYTSFPFGLTSPPAISCRRPPPLTLSPSIVHPSSSSSCSSSVLVVVVVFLYIFFSAFPFYFCSCAKMQASNFSIAYF